jgi:uncharacterized protein YecE (DUF72 family)
MAFNGLQNLLRRNLRQFFGLDFVQSSAVHPPFRQELSRRDALECFKNELFQLRMILKCFALEIRHQSWNDSDILSRLAETGVGFCNIDQPHLGQSLRATEHVTAPVGYVRLHGRNYQEWFQPEGRGNRNDRYNYLYKRKELEGWKERITHIAQQTEKTYVIANNHFKGQAPVNALELKNMLSGQRVKAPATLVEHYPEQLGEIADLT